MLKYRYMLDEQKGSELVMPADMLGQPESYYIASLRLRRELTPLPDLLAYRCITMAVDGPDGDDIVIADQVAFEDRLIELEVYKSRRLVHGAYAKIWRALQLDQLLPLRRSSEPQESLLYRLDSPYRKS